MECRLVLCNGNGGFLNGITEKRENGEKCGFWPENAVFRTENSVSLP